VVASLVAAGGRLLLALAMGLVSDKGGEYVFCDTDSLFIAATRFGSPKAYEGGSVNDGNDSAINLLSWCQVDRIIARFRQLNPYDGGNRPRSILELEGENFEEGIRREILCYSIVQRGMSYSF